MFVDRSILFKAFLPTVLSTGLFGFVPINKDSYKIITNYNGQADLLLSLQIPTDYYPYEFQKQNLHFYLTKLEKYFISNEHVSKEKQELGPKLQKRILELLSKVVEFGPGLWDKSMYSNGMAFKNDQFWRNKKTDLLLLEQFVAEEYKDIEEAYKDLPSHKDLLITNHRIARDPYTIFSKQVFECFKQKNCTNKLGSKLKQYVQNYNKVEVNALYRFGKYIEFWNNLFENNKKELDKAGIESWIKERNIFSLDSHEDHAISKEYASEIFSEEELKLLKQWESNWSINYKNPKITLTHHPVLEQTRLPGTAPLSEGSQKDTMLFLFQIASLIQKFSDSSNFKENFKDDYRKTAMQNALANAKEISNNFKDRLTNIREYFKAIDVVDKQFNPGTANTNTNSKSFAILTFPPRAFGGGEIVINSMSKYSFIYQDIGLKQVIPKNFLNNSHSHDEHKHEEEHQFSVDDGGWWWSLGNSNISSSKLLNFKEQADKVLLLATEEDWNLLSSAKNLNSILSASALLKQESLNFFTSNPSRSRNSYHLWNEGVRSPIALNLVLDNLVDIFQKQYDSNFNSSHIEKYKKAMDWGNYWQNHFINGTHSN